MSTNTKKYEMFKQEKHNGFTYYRIRAIKNFGNVKNGTVGGLIQSENNLSQTGKCWIDESSIVRNPTIIRDNVLVCKESLLEDFVVFKGNRILENVRILDRASGGIDCENKESNPIIVDDNTKLVPKHNAGGWRIKPPKTKNPIKITLEFDSIEQLRKFDTAVENIIDEDLSNTERHNTFIHIYEDIIEEPISQALSEFNNKLSFSKVIEIVKCKEPKYKNLKFEYQKDNIHITHEEFDLDVWIGCLKKGTYVTTSDDCDGQETKYFVTENKFKKYLSENLDYYNNLEGDDCYEDEDDIDD